MRSVNAQLWIDAGHGAISHIRVKLVAERWVGVASALDLPKTKIDRAHARSAQRMMRVTEGQMVDAPSGSPSERFRLRQRAATSASRPTSIPSLTGLR